VSAELEAIDNNPYNECEPAANRSATYATFNFAEAIFRTLNIGVARVGIVVVGTDPLRQLERECLGASRAERPGAGPDSSAIMQLADHGLINQKIDKPCVRPSPTDWATVATAYDDVRTCH